MAFLRRVAQCFEQGHVKCKGVKEEFQVLYLNDGLKCYTRRRKEHFVRMSDSFID